ncbi:hypothetical protein NDU88_004248 [Pleurodeles waltl]|uniref:Uncharacterized protein n=1 Tax=Pleurodeles waltl TaxID=8319 RepID=A0AAV7NMW8_PLEWA|nr:hypothetical protein NDU88_004248 [Pleurodeles waltl]
MALEAPRVGAGVLLLPVYVPLPLGPDFQTRNAPGAASRNHAVPRSVFVPKRGGAAVPDPPAGLLPKTEPLAPPETARPPLPLMP